ncbi:AAA family ATPase [Pseudomonas sp. JDS28PS106]|uniref:AAA family ATPase n=1 Tax=Pseudomonas sp. JDS28PS106 TaxID=2497235 RepID=UPI002FD0323A
MNINSIWSSKLTKYVIENSDSQIHTGRFNLLIGPNNSGKSRLLRTLFTSNQSEMQIAFGTDLEEALQGASAIKSFMIARPRISNFNSEAFIKLSQGMSYAISEIKLLSDSFLKVLAEARRHTYSLSGGGDDVAAFQSFQQMFSIPGSHETDADTIAEILSNLNQSLSLKHHYVPILRGMRPLDPENDAFRNRTIKDYFPDAKTSGAPNIITGFDLYQLLVRFLLGHPGDRERIRAYEKILGHEFFGGAEITLIPEYGKDTVSVKIGDDDQFPIYDLGDGLQQVIIITSSAFLERENSIFFIEEPEACLHPGLLRKLALFLLNHTNHYYFATTHSNHLLDLAEIDTRVVIQKVTKIGNRSKATYRVQESTRDRELLAELGITASSVYLANSTIWVEGITDRLYLAVFLKKYIETRSDLRRKSELEGLLENFHYAFVEYQGGTLGHWSFDEDDDLGYLSASNICSSAFVIADGDIAGKGDRATILEAQLGMRLHILKCKEIENLLPRNVILDAAKAIYSRKHKGTVSGLSADNLDKLTDKIEDSANGIGYLLDKALGLKGRGKQERRVFADQSGTINDKVKFCLEAIEVMNRSPWDLTPPLTDLCNKVFDHILAVNHQ